MKIKHLIQEFTGDLDTSTIQLVSVQRAKYSDVRLCFDCKPWNISFAEIKLHTRDRYMDRTTVFPDCVNLGNEIAKRWNQQQRMPISKDGQPIFIGDKVFYHDEEAEDFSPDPICEMTVTHLSVKEFDEYTGNFTVGGDRFEAGNLEFFANRESIRQKIELRDSADLFSVFTVGHETNYDRGIAEQGKNFHKLGRSNDYPGGFAVRSPEDAERLIDELGKRGEWAVYALAADWDKDTVPSENGWWHALVQSSPVVRKIPSVKTDH